MSAQKAVSKNEPREHLAGLRTLSQHLSAAISAIARNDLAQLQNSIAAQEVLCRELTSTPMPVSALAAEPTLLAEIRATRKELAQLNRIYAAVLKKAQRSTALMTALYRSFGQGYAKDAPPAGQPMLSCEV